MRVNWLELGQRQSEICELMKRRRMQGNAVQSDGGQGIQLSWVEEKEREEEGRGGGFLLPEKQWPQQEAG